MNWYALTNPSLLLTQVGDALAAVAEHRRALEQAEKLEQEFIALMTGHSPRKTPSSTVSSMQCNTDYNMHTLKLFTPFASFLTSATSAGIRFSQQSKEEDYKHRETHFGMSKSSIMIM